VSAVSVEKALFPDEKGRLDKKNSRRKAVVGDAVGVSVDGGCWRGRWATPDELEA
jgi:hypothetical protein